MNTIDFNIPADGSTLFTLAGPVRGEGTYLTQTCAPSRYGHIVLRIEPYAGPTAFRVEWQVPPTEVPTRYADTTMDAIREAVAQQLADGSRLGSARIVVIGGGYHDGDTTEMTCTLAAQLAVRHALQYGERA